MSEWKEFTAPSGRKYYHNKATGESKWTLPDALKAAGSTASAAAAGQSPAPTQNAQPPSVQVSICHSSRAHEWRINALYPLLSNMRQ